MVIRFRQPKETPREVSYFFLLFLDHESNLSGWGWWTMTSFQPAVCRGGGENSINKLQRCPLIQGSDEQGSMEKKPSRPSCLLVQSCTDKFTLSPGNLFTIQKLLVEVDWGGRIPREGIPVKLFMQIQQVNGGRTRMPSSRDFCSHYFWPSNYSYSWCEIEIVFLPVPYLFI